MNVRGSRTPLALAFGDHPARCNGVYYGADKPFFRNAVVPFLDEQVVRGGRRAIIIHEFNIFFDLNNLDPKNASHIRHVEGIMKEAEKNANAHFRQTLDAGRPLRENAGWFDWGYLDYIAEINGRTPNMITNIVEPQRGSTLWLMNGYGSQYTPVGDADSFANRVAAEAESIRGSIRICLERSRRVSALVKEIRRKYPDAAIVVPRGYAHKGMAVDFDQSEFQLTVSERLKGVPLFSSEAIAASFSGALGDAEIARYARLSIYYSEYVAAAAEKPDNETEAFELSARARGYALDKERGTVGSPLLELRSA